MAQFDLGSWLAKLNSSTGVAFDAKLCLSGEVSRKKPNQKYQVGVLLLTLVYHLIGLFNIHIVLSLFSGACCATQSAHGTGSAASESERQSLE